MVKRQCDRCRYWFAVRAEAAETTAICPRPSEGVE
jgi:hypothetical protein